MPRLVDIGNTDTFINKNRDMFYDVIYDSGVSVSNCADKVFIVRCEIIPKRCEIIPKSMPRTKTMYFKIKYNSEKHSKEMQDILNCIDSLFQFRLFQKIVNYLNKWYCGGFRYGNEFINFEQDLFITDYDVLAIE